MRQFYDVMVYLDPPEPMRREWKVKRNTAKCDYAPGQVSAELDRRESDSATFIRLPPKHADSAVRFYPYPTGHSDGAHLNVRLTLRPTIRHPDLTYLNDDQCKDCGVRLGLERDDTKPVDVLEIAPNVSSEHTVKLRMRSIGTCPI